MIHSICNKYITFLLCVIYKFFIILVLNKFAINLQVINYLFTNHKQFITKYHNYTNNRESTEGCH